MIGRLDYPQKGVKVYLSAWIIVKLHHTTLYTLPKFREKIIHIKKGRRLDLMM